MYRQKHSKRQWCQCISLKIYLSRKGVVITISIACPFKCSTERTRHGPYTVSVLVSSTCVQSRTQVVKLTAGNVNRKMSCLLTGHEFSTSISQNAKQTPSIALTRTCPAAEVLPWKKYEPSTCPSAPQLPLYSPTTHKTDGRMMWKPERCCFAYYYLFLLFVRPLPVVTLEFYVLEKKLKKM